MAKILKPQVKATGLIDSFELAVMKSVGERVLAPVIGNSSIKSGAVKLVGAGVLGSISRNKHIGLFSSSMIVDGFEDIVSALLGGSGVGAGESEGAW